MPFLFSVLYVAILGIASHFIGEALPRRFQPDRFPFRSWKWEREGKIYDKIRIRAWKDHMPDMSRIMKDMVPKRVGPCPKAEQVRVLIQETCVAEVVHVSLCLLAPVIYCFWWNGVGVLLSVLVVVGNLPFILIQRYNRPALIVLEARLKAREERKKRHASVDSVG